MMVCKGGVCPVCGTNIYIDINDEKKCGCNMPKSKGFENNKKYNGGLVKSELTCKRCGKFEVIYRKRKINKNRNLCDDCLLLVRKKQQKRKGKIKKELNKKFKKKNYVSISQQGSNEIHVCRDAQKGQRAGI